MAKSGDVGDNCQDVKTCRGFGRCRLTGGPIGDCDREVETVKEVTNIGIGLDKLIPALQGMNTSAIEFLEEVETINENLQELVKEQAQNIPVRVLHQIESLDWLVKTGSTRRLPDLSECTCPSDGPKQRYCPIHGKEAPSPR